MIYLDWVDVSYHYFASHHMSNTHYIHRFSISDYYSCRFYIITLLNKWCSDMINQNYSRYTITINVDDVDYNTITNIVYSYQLTWSINRDSS